MIKKNCSIFLIKGIYLQKAFKPIDKILYLYTTIFTLLFICNIEFVCVQYLEFKFINH